MDIHGWKHICLPNTFTRPRCYGLYKPAQYVLRVTQRKSNVYCRKTLGIHVQGNLQVEHVLNKGKELLSAFRFLWEYLTEKQFLKVASANCSGSAYYTASVWFQNLNQSQKQNLPQLISGCLELQKGISSLPLAERSKLNSVNVQPLFNGSNSWQPLV